VKRKLAQWFPRQDAPAALDKKAYNFDPGTYTWTRKTKKKAKSR